MCFRRIAAAAIAAEAVAVVAAATVVVAAVAAVAAAAAAADVQRRADATGCCRCAEPRPAKDRSENQVDSDNCKNNQQKHIAKRSLYRA